MMTYEQWRGFLQYVVDGAIAEHLGFAHAKQFVTPQIYHDPQYQVRYEQGFRMGKDKLAEQELPV